MDPQRNLTQREVLEKAIATALHDPSFAHDDRGYIHGHVGRLVVLIADAVERDMDSTKRLSLVDIAERALADYGEIDGHPVHRGSD